MRKDTEGQPPVVRKPTKLPSSFTSKSSNSRCTISLTLNVGSSSGYMVDSICVRTRVSSFLVTNPSLSTSYILKLTG